MVKSKQRLIPLPKNSLSRIPHGVAQIKNNDKSEVTNFRLAFDYYQEKATKSKDLGVSVLRQFHDQIVAMGKSNYTTLKELQPCPVYNSGHYKTLYKDVPKDSDVFEIKLSNSARLFYFRIENELYIISLMNKHLETDKNKR